MNALKRRWIYWLLLCIVPFLGGCGVLTGLPGHGGGKRFAVEQELVAAATRGAIKQIDLTALYGKKVNIYVNAIGDTGNGNIIGGRFSVVSQLRGDYIQSPPTLETSTFPRYTSTTASNSSTNSSGTTAQNQEGSTTGTTGTTPSNSTSTTTTTGSSSNYSTTTGTSTTDSVLPMADSKTTRQKGKGGVAQLGLEFKGLGAYQNSDQISSNDLQYLSGLLQTYLFLRGVYVVPPSEAEIDVYITIDVFGTVRSRVEWFIANNEILRAKTSLEVMAVDHLNGTLVMPPKSAGAEAEYNEQFILWVGPVMIRQTLQKAKPLLSDFTDFSEDMGSRKTAEQNIAISYPFQIQVDKMMMKNDEHEMHLDDSNKSE